MLNGHRHVDVIWIADTAGTDGRLAEIRELASHQRVSVESVPRQQIENYVGKVNHQSVLALADPFSYTSLPQVMDHSGTIVVLDHVGDPQNLGTLIRAAAAFDIAGLVIPTDRAANVTAAVVNASSGAIESVAVCRVVNLQRAVQEIKDSGRWVIALDGGDDSVSIYDQILPTPACLILGSEGKGISQRMRSSSDVVVRIPIGKAVESLNVATAGSIALFELARQRYLASDH